MTTESKDRHGKSLAERRQDKKPRRRLVDLTRMAGTDRRGKKGRRRGDQPEDSATERLSEEE